MGESTKALCALVLIVGTIAAVIAWTAGHPDPTTWAFRIGGPTLALLALGLILKLHFRADLAHDPGEASAIVRWVFAFLAAFGLFWLIVLPCSVGMLFLDHWVARAKDLTDTDAPSFLLGVAGLYVGYWYIIPLATLCTSFVFFLRFLRCRLRRSSRS